MRTFILLTWLMVSACIDLLQAQCPTTGSVTLSNDTQAQAFYDAWPNCKNLEIPLTITGSVSNLEPLEGLETVQTLSIQNNGALPSLNGFPNLTEVKGNLIIHMNNILKSVYGMEKLEKVGGHVQITENPELVSLAKLIITTEDTYEGPGGLQKLGAVGGTLQIANRNKLQSISGLSGLKTVGENLQINDHFVTSLAPLGSLVSIGGLSIDCDNLVSLNGFSQAITSLAGNLVVTGDRLASIAALSNITQVGRGLYVNDLPALTSLEGLHNITSIGANLPTITNSAIWIINNSEITSLQGLNKVVSIRGEVSIRDNAKLTTLAGMGNGMTINGSLLISNNPALTSLAMGSLTSLSGTLTITNNTSLASMAGLGSFTTLGSLVVGAVGPMASLSGLENLVTIWGNANISGSLTSLSGFGSNLAVWGILRLQNLPNLTSLSGLGSVSQIGTISSLGSNVTGLYINNNNSLVSLTGLNAGVAIQNLRIENNPALQTMTGLGVLTSINGDLIVTENPVLNSLTGLGSLTSARSVIITDNDLLESLSGLDGLESVTGNFTMFRNPLISSLGGLGKLKTVGTSFYITLSNGLKTLAGLDKLEKVTSGFILTSNSQLAICGTEAVCSLLSDPGGTGSVSISGNAYGCQSQEQVEAACYGTLPVTLADFSVTLEGNMAVLQWVTTEEVNASHFEIERSRHASAWQKIGKVQSKRATREESKTAQSYSFTDHHIAASDSPNSYRGDASPHPHIFYYRIKMIDIDGSYAYSPIKSVAFGGSGGLVAYPNPVSDRLFLAPALLSDIQNIGIYTISGQKVLEERKLWAERGLDLSALSEGLYVLKVRLVSGQTRLQKIVIVK